MVKTLTNRQILEIVSGGTVECQCGFADSRFGVDIATRTTEFSETTLTPELIVDRYKNQCCGIGKSASGMLYWYSIGEKKYYCGASNKGSTTSQKTLLSIVVSVCAT